MSINMAINNFSYRMTVISEYRLFYQNFFRLTKDNNWFVQASLF